VSGLPGVLLAFAVVQAAFIALDALTLRSLARAGAAPALRGVGAGAVAFLGVVGAVYFAIQNALLAALPPTDAMVETLAAALGLGPGTEDAGPATLALLLAVTFVVAGFWDYALHRWLLHGRWGWFLHENHHLPTVVANGIPGISVRPFVAVTTALTSLGTAVTMLSAMALAGLAGLVEDYLRVLPALVLVLTAVGSASHSAFLRRFPAVHRVLGAVGITTPQEHVLHHATGRQGNYGNFTSLWDRVFGTYLAPAAAGAPPPRLGLAYDQDFLGTLTAGRWKLSAAVRRRYRLEAFCHLHRRPGAANEEPAP
jgi:sterol desaturase/sphingolipid hydroxylase (fatty acid hydroxylase superfamily)